MSKFVIKANRTADDVVANNEQVLAYSNDIEEARQKAIDAQRVEGFIAAWVEPVIRPARPAKIERSIERDIRSHQRITVTRCDGWVI